MKRFVAAVLATLALASPSYAAPQHDHGKHHASRAHPQRAKHVVHRTHRRIKPRSVASHRRHRARAVVHRRGLVHNRYHYRRWNRGQRFDRRYARNYRVISDWRRYRGRRLYAPPRGYHWVRSGNDAVLVAITGGLIGAVLAGAFN